MHIRMTSIDVVTKIYFETNPTLSKTYPIT